VTLTCHPPDESGLRTSSEAKPKDRPNEKEILRFAQNDSFAVTSTHFRHFVLVSWRQQILEFNSLIVFRTINGGNLRISCKSGRKNTRFSRIHARYLWPLNTS
jgi:hypothetical protein